MLRRHLKYTLSRKKMKELFSCLYLFIGGCKFVIIELRAYDIAHHENAMSLLMIQIYNRVG